MKTSKILEITKTKLREGANGKLYYITLRLENWEYITLWKKREDAFKVGQIVKYEEIEKWKKWKEVKEKSFAQDPKSTIVLTAFQVAFSAKHLAPTFRDCLNLVDRLIPEIEWRINGTIVLEPENHRKEIEEMTSDDELDAQQEALMEEDFSS